MTIDHVCAMLKQRGVSRDSVEKDIVESGKFFVNPDGTIDIVRYTAWLMEKVRVSGQI